MPNPKDDPKSSGWRAYIFARDQWHCRICGDRFLYSEMVRKHIANEHNETCRRACMNTSTAQFGSERNSLDLALQRRCHRRRQLHRRRRGDRHPAGCCEQQNKFWVPIGVILATRVLIEPAVALAM